MALAPGTRLGPYEILSALGAGGMGEVWKARDTRLDRLVAIKTSQSRFSERFEREARAIAAVNHPHVCALYDVGPDYLVMEYLEGEGLRGPVPVARALALADQILDALDAAHRKGVVHRDLKPGNILLTASGVKVLDFGLAKVAQTAAGDSRSQIDTRAVSLTGDGSILGTVPYMSPEQIEGREADTRSDIFAFGVVLYELVAGTRPFTGETQTQLVASILKEEPRPLADIQPATPHGLAEVVLTCLEKDPEKRWQSARDVRRALRLVAAEPQAPRPARPPRVWQALAALLAVVALGLGGWLFRPATPGPVVRLEAPAPEDVTPLYNLSVSPDGRTLVFEATGEDGLWIRDLHTLEWRRLPGTEQASAPFWSPDNRHLGFTVDNTFMKIDTTGGPPEMVASIPNVRYGSGTWNGNGDVVLGSWSSGSGGPLWSVSRAGAVGAVTEVDVSRGEFFHTWPTFLPDGRRFLYFRSGPPDVGGLYVGSLDVDAADQSRQRVLAVNVPAVYANGFVFFWRAGTLMAQVFDAGRLEAQGVAVPVAQDVDITWYRTPMLSVSDSGVLAYRTAPPPTANTYQLAWLDRQGTVLSTFGQPETDGFIALSPDNKSAVVKDAGYNVPGDLWRLYFESDRRSKLTFDKRTYSPGVWSPDGARIAYSAGDLGDTIVVKAASGLGDEEILLHEPGLRHFPTSWSSDGEFLLYHVENTPGTGSDQWVLSLRDRTPHLLVGEAFNEWAGVFSPDGRFVAYVSLASGVPQVIVRPFRVSGESGEPSFGQGEWQVSRDIGNWPQWRVNGEIVFNTVPERWDIFAAPVSTAGNGFEFGVAQRLPYPPNVRVGTQATEDGRFLVGLPLEPPERPSFSVVLNWPALLQQ